MCFYKEIFWFDDEGKTRWQHTDNSSRLLIAQMPIKGAYRLTRNWTETCFLLYKWFYKGSLHHTYVHLDCTKKVFSNIKPFWLSNYTRHSTVFFQVSLLQSVVEVGKYLWFSFFSQGFKHGVTEKVLRNNISILQILKKSMKNFHLRQGRFDIENLNNVVNLVDGDCLVACRM